jgi:toxin ParE1/3/4
VATFRFSRRAEADLLTIGRIADEVRRGLRRHEHQKHVIFYREDRKGIVIVRILHQRMLPERHDHDEDTD